MLERESLYSVQTASERQLRGCCLFKTCSAGSFPLFQSKSVTVETRASRVNRSMTALATSLQDHRTTGTSNPSILLSCYHAILVRFWLGQIGNWCEPALPEQQV